MAEDHAENGSKYPERCVLLAIGRGQQDGGFLTRTTSDDLCWHHRCSNVLTSMLVGASLGFMTMVYSNAVRKRPAMAGKCAFLWASRTSVCCSTER